MSGSSASRPEVFILLATYEGSRFLREQVASIQAQTFGDWRLVIRDDGSRDRTLAVAGEVAAGDARIHILADDRGRLGPAGNFGVLLEHARAAGAASVFLADQDDVWQPDKIQRQLDRMRASEQALGADVPLLLHTDLAIVDAQLRTIHPSFMARQGWQNGPENESPLATLLARNFVTGCTVVANRALVELAVPVPKVVAMHDWWLALCAAAAGRIDYLAEPTVHYRQHGANHVGARRLFAANPLARAGRARYRRAVRNFYSGVAQAHALEARLTETGRGQTAAAELVEAYCRLFAPDQPGYRRVFAARALGIQPRGLWNRLFYDWCLMSLGARCARPQPTQRANSPIRRE
ncbi:MAG: glycosyltransferase family 2 protein [Pirellulales bacterium]